MVTPLTDNGQQMYDTGKNTIQKVDKGTINGSCLALTDPVILALISQRRFDYKCLGNLHTFSLTKWL